MSVVGCGADGVESAAWESVLPAGCATSDPNRPGFVDDRRVAIDGMHNVAVGGIAQGGIRTIWGKGQGEALTASDIRFEPEGVFEVVMLNPIRVLALSPGAALMSVTTERGCDSIVLHAHAPAENEIHMGWLHGEGLPGSGWAIETGHSVEVYTRPLAADGVILTGAGIADWGSTNKQLVDVRPAATQCTTPETECSVLEFATLTAVGSAGAAVVSPGYGTPREVSIATAPFKVSLLTRAEVTAPFSTPGQKLTLTEGAMRLVQVPLFDSENREVATQRLVTVKSTNEPIAQLIENADSFYVIAKEPGATELTVHRGDVSTTLTVRVEATH